MSSIRETITNALPTGTADSYRQYVNIVVRELEERERGLRAQLLQHGTRLGASQRDINQVLDTVGLTAPEPVAQARPGFGGGVGDGISRNDARAFLDQLSQLVENARSTIGR